jgi:hypothetical protein
VKYTAARLTQARRLWSGWVLTFYAPEPRRAPGHPHRNWRRFATRGAAVQFAARREAGFDEATLARMVRATKPDIEAACVAAAFLFSPERLPPQEQLSGVGRRLFVLDLPEVARVGMINAADTIVAEPTEQRGGTATGSEDVRPDAEAR